jgi:hypothetical protein
MVGGELYRAPALWAPSNTLAHDHGELMPEQTTEGGPRLTAIVSDTIAYTNYLGNEVARTCATLGVPVPLSLAAWVELNGMPDGIRATRTANEQENEQQLLD